MTTEEKKLVTKQIVSVQNELAKLQNLLQDEGEEPYESDKFECIAVTQVDVFPFQGGVNLGHMKGLARVVLNDQLVIRGLRIMDGFNGLFVSYPDDPFFKGEDLRSIVFPITCQLREHIENCVLEKYQAAIA
jgi:stage V sporulation protein G